MKETEAKSNLVQRHTYTGLQANTSIANSQTTYTHNSYSIIRTLQARTDGPLG
jgi:hypothetical protein